MISAAAAQRERRPSVASILTKRRPSLASLHTSDNHNPVFRNRRPSIDSAPITEEPRDSLFSKPTGFFDTPHNAARHHHNHSRPHKREPDPPDLCDAVDDFLAIFDDDELLSESYLRDYTTTQLSRFARWQLRGRSMAACFEAACLAGARFLQEHGLSPSDRTHALDAALARALAGVVVDAVEPEVTLYVQGPVREKAVMIVADEFLSKAAHDRVAVAAKRRSNKRKSGYAGPKERKPRLEVNREESVSSRISIRRGSDSSYNQQRHIYNMDNRDALSIPDTPETRSRFRKLSLEETKTRSPRSATDDPYSPSENLERTRFRKHSLEDVQERSPRFRNDSLERVAEEGGRYPKRSVSIERVARYRKPSLEGDILLLRKSSRDESIVNTPVHENEPPPPRKESVGRVRRGSRDEIGGIRSPGWNSNRDNVESSGVLPSATVSPFAPTVYLPPPSYAGSPLMSPRPQNEHHQRGESLGWQGRNGVPRRQ